MQLIDCSTAPGHLVLIYFGTNRAQDLAQEQESRPQSNGLACGVLSQFLILLLICSLLYRLDVSRPHIGQPHSPSLFVYLVAEGASN